MSTFRAIFGKPQYETPPTPASFTLKKTGEVSVALGCGTCDFRRVVAGPCMGSVALSIPQTLPAEVTFTDVIAVGDAVVSTERRTVSLNRAACPGKLFCDNADAIACVGDAIAGSPALLESVVDPQTITTQVPLPKPDLNA